MKKTITINDKQTVVDFNRDTKHDKKTKTATGIHVATIFVINGVNYSVEVISVWHKSKPTKISYIYAGIVFPDNIKKVIEHILCNH